jgi:hypothetical protein
MQEGAWLEAEAVAGKVVRPELDRPLHGQAPGVEALKGHPVDEVEADVVESRLPSQLKRDLGLAPVAPPLQDA